MALPSDPRLTAWVTHAQRRAQTSRDQYRARVSGSDITSMGPGMYTVANWWSYP